MLGPQNGGATNEICPPVTIGKGGTQKQVTVQKVVIAITKNCELHIAKVEYPPIWEDNPESYKCLGPQIWNKI